MHKDAILSCTLFVPEDIFVNELFIYEATLNVSEVHGMKMDGIL